MKSLDLRRYQIAMRAIELAEKIALSSGSGETEENTEEEKPEAKAEVQYDDPFMPEAAEDALTASLNNLIKEVEAEPLE